ncbi:MAG: YbaN family protein [Thiogranum sp.]|nr:YbaN family protein [Thiogranum sp.]
MRALYFLLGWCLFGLGAVGTVVPGLPTTPFMLLALWAFAKSSRRFHDWLYAHPVFGPPLQQWRMHGVIPGRAKLLSVVTMAASFIYLAFFTGVSAWTKALIALVMLYGAAFILSKPSQIRQPKT